MGNEGKLSKGFSPSRFPRKSPEVYENKKVREKKEFSPQNKKHQGFKEEEIKQIKMVHEVFPKGKPTWLAEKST